MGKKKVGGAQEATESKKKKRVAFDLNKAQAMLPVLDKDGKPTAKIILQKAVNVEGKLLAIPVTIKDGEKVTYDGWDSKRYKPFAKKDFADEPTYLRFKALTIGEKAKRMMALSESLALKADQLAKFGDKTTQKKVKKLSRMREALAALEADLKQEGYEDVEA